MFGNLSYKQLELLVLHHTHRWTHRQFFLNTYSCKLRYWLCKMYISGKDNHSPSAPVSVYICDLIQQSAYIEQIIPISELLF